MRTSFYKLTGTFRLIILVILTCVLCLTISKAQNVAITDNESYVAETSAMLDVMSTNKEMLIPRLTSAQRTGITSPAQGLMVYDTDLKSFMYYAGTKWITIPSLTSTAGTGESLFAVVNHLGDTVFAVYHDGVRIFVDPEAKGKVGGFAISGRTPTKEGEKVEYFRVTPDSTRIYVNDSIGAKGRVGGFAISGRTPTKENGIKEYFTINKDSTRIYVDSIASKGKVGGFAISGRTPTKDGTTTKFMNITKDNYFIGHEAGKSTTTGLYNSFMGYQAGTKNRTGSTNSFMGYQAGYWNDTASSNVMLGYQAGFANDYGFNNVFIGFQTGFWNTKTSGVEGSYNTFVGFQAGAWNLKGSKNVYLGYQAGGGPWPPISNGSFNVILGNESGRLITSGSYNAFMGFQAGFNTSTGSENTFIGYKAGHGNSTSVQLVCVGYKAGELTNGSNNTFIGSNCATRNSTGSNNTFIGAYSGTKNTTSYDNTALGSNAGFGHIIDGTSTMGRRNVILGSSAGSGFDHSIGENNVFVGWSSGYGEDSQIGNNNVFLGCETGFSYKRNLGSGNIFIGYQAGLNESGSNRLYIDNSSIATPLVYGEFDNNILVFNANVGIEAPSPSNKLQIGTVLTNGTATATLNSISLASDYGNKTVGSNFKLKIFEATNQVYNYGFGISDYLLEIVAGLNGSIGFFTSGANERMRIDASGNVGIGISPSTKLDINGILTLRQAAGGTAAKKWSIYYNAYDAADYGLVFHRISDDIQYLTLGNGGACHFNSNLGIGTYPYATLHIKGNASVINIEGTDHCYMQWYPDGYAAGRKGYFGYPSPTSNDIVLANEISGGHIVLAPVGNVGIGLAVPDSKFVVYNGSTTGRYTISGWTHTSDIRLKENITPVIDALEEVIKLQGVRFNFITDSEKKTQIGLIAQDVEKVFPEFVETDKDGYKSLAYGSVNAVLIEAIKEQQQQIEQLKSELEAIKAELSRQK